MTGLITFTSIHNPQLFTDKELEAFFKLLFKPFLNRTNSNQEKALLPQISNKSCSNSPNNEKMSQMTFDMINSRISYFKRTVFDCK